MRQLLFIGFLFIITNAWSQRIELAIQRGHSGDIEQVAFNADGRLLASAGSDNLIKLWHVPTGKEMVSFMSPTTARVQSLLFSDGDESLFVQYVDGRINTWDIVESKLDSMHQKPTNFQKADQYRSRDGSFEVLIDRFYLKKRSVQTGKILFSRVPIDISKNFTSVAVSETNNLIIASNEDGKIYAFNLVSGKSLGVLDGHFTSVNHLCFNRDESLFATASSDRSILLWDANTRKQVRRLFGRSFRFEAVAFNHSGTQLAVGDELGKCRIIDLLSTRIKVTTHSLHEQKVGELAFSKNDSTIFSGAFDNRLIAYSLPKSEAIETDNYKNYFSAGDFLLKTFNAYREPFAWINAVAVSPSGEHVAVGGSWRESVPRKRAEPILIQNLKTNKTDKLLAHQGGIDDIAFIDNSNFLSVHANQLYRWYYDPATTEYYYRKLTIPHAKNLKQVIVTDKNTLLLRDHNLILHFDLQKESVIDSVRTAKEITYMAYQAHQGVIAYSQFNALSFTSINNLHTSTEILMAHSDRITGMDFSPTQPLLATVSWDATIKLWNPERGTLIATIISVGSLDHIIITPDNYYYGTHNSLQGFGFKYGKQFFSPEQFDLRFNRPDIVLQRLGFVPENVVRSFNRAYRKRLQKMNFTEEMLGADIQLPEITITSDQGHLVKNQQYSLTLRATDKKYELDRIQVFVNNVPVYGTGGIDLRAANTQQKESKIDLALSPGKNKIQVSCLNKKGVESLLQTIEVDYQIERAPTPTLYLAVISVSSYKDDRMNLKYAAKDGRDIIKAFSKIGWFDRVVIDSLLNDQATKENILSLRNKFMKSSVSDHVIVYVSGHGLLDEHLEFYFATHDVDFKNPAVRGVRYDDLENLLDGIPARNKLLLMDACHSGEVDKSSIKVSEATLATNAKGTVKSYSYPSDVAEEHFQVGIKTSFELMQELFSNLSKGSGAVVISAAAGNSYALESDEWRNGVFTYSLLNGLKSKEADKNSNGQVTVTELKDYVSREVEKLTQGAQKPTSRRENLEFDFRVF